MIRDVLTDKWFLDGCGFLIVFGIACYFWNQHELAPYKEGVAEAQRQQETSLKTTKNSQADTLRTASMKTTPVKGTANATDTGSENINSSNSPKVESHEKTAADVPVSPHGFGPYPPLPPGWRGTPEKTWGNCVDPDHELIARVQIKLLWEGIDVRGGTTMNGKIYPIIKGIRYVEWDTDNGVRYISGSMGLPEDGDRLRAIKRAKVARGGKDYLTEADIPPDIKLINMEEGGVDPYEFLGLTPP